MKAKRTRYRKTPVSNPAPWSNEWPKELLAPMSLARDLANPLIDLGEHAPWTEAHTTYWDCVTKKKRGAIDTLFAFLRSRGFEGLTPLSPPTDLRWKRLALQLAEAAFPALQDPKPKRPGPDNGQLDALDKVAAAHRASPHPISNKDAYESVGVSRTRFFAAKKKYVTVAGPGWWRTWQRPPFK
jgi:hypothetical protein